MNIYIEENYQNSFNCSKINHYSKELLYFLLNIQCFNLKSRSGNITSFYFNVCSIINDRFCFVKKKCVPFSQNG
ncbi:hypothetical protein BpHYR1_014351 [Brachionus plicatilis]|uniref:Uncharacterized protein n=1 Tax=Brachionus plicatilis TaxID=10195 RepID=A0A3M7SV64_BRAPC|nr:hypothetical protein BpHYR1_014351 [Brachionus plicatilis]